MKQRAHLPRRHEHIITLVVRDQEAEAVLVTNHPALYQIELIGQGIAIASVADQLAVTDHGIDTPPQRLDTILIPYIQQCFKIGTVNGMVCLGNNFKNQLATGDGLIIERRLAPGVWITALR